MVANELNWLWIGESSQKPLKLSAGSWIWVVAVKHEVVQLKTARNSQF